MDQDKNIPSRVAEILRKTGRKECMEKAQLLIHSENKSTNLNLRDLGLRATEAEQLALVLMDIEKNGSPKVDSISFSYNHFLKDEGAVTLIKSLPISTRELGFVDCGIEESGGRELLNWIKKAPNLSMLCAEQNSFSDQLKSEFVRFSMEHPKVMVVV